MKKLLLLIILVICIFAFPVLTAFAEEGEIVEGTTIEETGGGIDDAWFKDKVLPYLIAGGSGLTVLLPFILKLIKYIGENKSIKAAYAVLKDTANKASDENKALKEQLETFNLDAVLKGVTDSVITAVVDKIGGLVVSELNKRTDLSGQVLANTEVISQQLHNFLNAAVLAWKEVDGTAKLLTQSPNTAVMELQAKTIQFLKTYVAEKLGLETAELQAEIDKAVAVNG